MVRAGKGAFLIDEFKERNIVALGWGLGDLKDKNVDDIKRLMQEKYPDESKYSLGIASSQVIKFRHMIEKGDYVLSYNPSSRKYLVGEIGISPRDNCIAASVYPIRRFSSAFLL